MSDRTNEKPVSIPAFAEMCGVDKSKIYNRIAKGHIELAYKNPRMIDAERYAYIISYYKNK